MAQRSSNRVVYFITTIMVLTIFGAGGKRHFIANICAIRLSDGIIEKSNRANTLADGICSAEFLLAEVTTLALAYEPISEPLSDWEVSHVGRLSKRDPVAWLRLGILLWGRGYKEMALSEWRSVDDVDLYFANRSAHAASHGDVATAQELARISLAIDPRVRIEEALVYDQLCELWQARDRLGYALPWCKLGAQARPNGWSQIQLARVQLELGDAEDAMNTLLGAVDTAPPAAEAAVYQALAELHMNAGNLEEGIAAYRTALQLGSNNPWIYLGLAKALLQAGYVQSACESFSQAKQYGYVPTDEVERDFIDCSSGESIGDS